MGNESTIEMDRKPGLNLTNEQWSVALELLAEMMDSGEPEKILTGQTDETLRSALEALWSQYQNAEKLQFLEKTITIVGELSSGGRDVFQPAQTLAGRFAILRRLGRGRMGEVYLADDQRLSETVALKTIRRAVARDPLNGARFLAEVQNSRHVTHPNVCRIFDLFEHDGVPFFSMEYVAGPTLAEVLAAGPMNQDRAKTIALQTAEGLLAAHQNGILHCDFKPNNILLSGSGKRERAVITDFGLARALGQTDSGNHATTLVGTPPFMAPELLRGEPATVRTDIFAYGKVVEALLPGSRLGARCAAVEAKDRPESLETVLRELSRPTTRRNWIVGLTLSLVSGSLLVYERLKPKMPLGSRQSVQVNGFKAETAELAETTQAVRRLLVMALSQSARLSVLDDRRYRPGEGPKVMEAGFALPLAALLEIARKQRVGLAVDGSVQAVAGGGLRLKVTVYDVSGAHPPAVTEVEVSDRRRVVALAEIAADDLRKNTFGEESKANSYKPLEEVTSKSADAVEYYFRAVSYFEKRQARPALIALDEALILDPEFTLAHNYRALVLLALGMLEKALESAERAYVSRNRLSTREQNWVEGVYRQVTRDFDGAADVYERNTTLFPDESFFYRQLAHNRMRQGRYDEGTEASRHAFELNPFSDSNASELVVNLAEANRLEECFAEAGKLAAAGGQEKTRDGLWLAYLQKGDYEASERECKPSGNYSEQDAMWKVSGLAPVIMSGRFSDAIRTIVGDLAWEAMRPESEKEQTYTQIRRNLLGQLYRLKDQPNLAREQAEWLLQLPALACDLDGILHGFVLACDLGDYGLAEKGVDKLRKIASLWSSSHTQSSAGLAEAMLKDAHGEPGADVLYERSISAWRDPINLFYVAAWHGKAGRPELQLKDLEELERLRGKVFKFHFAGLVVQGWLEQAKCLAAQSRFAESFRMYNRVLSHWGKPDASGRFLKQALQDYGELKRRNR